MEKNNLSEDLVSICIPIYNGFQFLEKSLQTAVNQTYRNVEILIVDDQSTDQSAEIVKKFQNLDPRIRYVVNEKNLGLLGNWKRCIDLAEGKWIKWLFQDDWLELDCVEKMLQACQSNKVEFCFCLRKYHFEDSVTDNIRKYYQDLFTFKKYFSKSFVTDPKMIASQMYLSFFYNIAGEPIVTFFSKALYLKYGGYNGDLVQLVDSEFNIKILLNEPCYVLMETLANFRVNIASESFDRFRNESKMVKTDLIEPMILYYEMLYDPYFARMKTPKEKRKLYFQTIKFFGGASQHHHLSAEQKQYLLQKYPKMHGLMRWQFLWKMKYILKGKS